MSIVRTCRSLCRAGAVLAIALCASLPALAQDAAALRARHASLQDKLASNQFGRPLVLESTQTAGDLKGDVYAVVDHPFATVQRALQSAEHWCDILILHLNVKRCKTTGTPKMINLNVGRKFDQPIEDAYQLDFSYRMVASTADYLQVQLSAPEGPLSTKNYRIMVEVVPVDARRSVVHMSYAYGYGAAARLAMSAYLGTIGSDKVGFSSSGSGGGADGKSGYIGGVRGVVERNTMRYFLAIESYLGAPAASQTDKRLADWFDATERHAQQLHEMDRGEYLEMKKKEIRRQQGGG